MTLSSQKSEIPELRPRKAKERAAERWVYGISVVIPLYNEQDNVSGLCKRLTRVLSKLKQRWEIIFIDDGSNDQTYKEICKLKASNPNVRAVRLRRNFGQTAALAAGFDHARGEVVITMDGDLQNHPEDIPRLISKLDEGYDLVSGWRVDRKDPFLRRVFPSRLANWLIGLITGTRLHDYGCSLKAYRREILDGLQIHGDMHRFIPAFAAALGARIAEVPVRHSPRNRGKSKYGILRTPIVMVDIIMIRFLLPYSFKPLKSFGMIGIGLLICGMAINLYLAYVRLFAGQGLSERPLLMLGVLLVIMGVQFLVLGILAELQVRALLDGGNRTYAIRECMGFAPKRDKDGDTGDPENDGPPFRKSWPEGGA